MIKRLVASVVACSIQVSAAAALDLSDMSPMHSSSRPGYGWPAVWQSFQTVYGDDLAYLSECLKTDANCTRTGTISWIQQLRNAQGLDRLEQLQSVNALVNALPTSWDHNLWRRPLATVEQGGDDEDRAVLKLYSLMALGWLPADVRVVVLNPANHVHSGDATVVVAKTAAGEMVLDTTGAELVDAASWKAGEGLVPQVSLFGDGRVGDHVARTDGHTAQQYAKLRSGDEPWAPQAGR